MEVMEPRLYRAIFRALCRVGYPIGGIRPRRIYHWLARRAYPGPPRGPEEFRWHSDRWGLRFLLHPYYLIDRDIIAFGNCEGQLLRFLHARIEPGMVCMDVGANLGEVTVHMAGIVGRGGRVHAFEPVPAVRERLAAHVHRNGMDEVVEIHPTALSSKSGTILLRCAGPAVSNQGMGSIAGQEREGDWRDIEVVTLRLDDFVERRGLERLDWMKVDVQGAEPLLLEGAVQTLGRLAPRIVIEVSPPDLAPLGQTSRDLLALLERLGYRSFEIRGLALGRPLHSSGIPPDYMASNIYCEKGPQDLR
jgi:FkbM family methyltransferase